ncbi:MAG: Band 7 protein [Verrucomicrobiales bacterium]|nr:Band 7 protein [Verrucomicrobiales bacterium]
MSDSHEHKTDGGKPGSVPLTSEDAGSQALSDALRSSFVIVKIVLFGLLIIFLGSGFFQVGPQERVIILQFGKPKGVGEKALLMPGFHWAWPAPIDEIQRVPAAQIQIASSTVGWYATTPEMEAAHSEPPPGASLNPAIDGYTLTSDANIIHVRATLRYRITDPIGFHFEFRNAKDFVTNALNNALFYASSRFTVDDVLTRKKVAFRETVGKRLDEIIEGQRLGIVVEQLDVDPIPPRQLQAKFNEVLQASVKRDDGLNKARSYENEVLSKARAGADSRLNSAQSERNRTVQLVSAEAKKFSDLLPEYQRNPELFTQWRQMETIQRVMANAQEKFFVRSREDGKPVELRLQLNREPQKPGTHAP